MASWNPNKVSQPSTIRLHLDPAGSPRWQIDITGVAFNLVIDGWGDDDDPLITVHGDASAHDGAAPSFSNLAVQYGDPPQRRQGRFDRRQQVLVFLPDAAKSPLDVSCQGGKLRIREAFPIPKLPLGLGYIEDISLDLGFDVDVTGKALSFSSVSATIKPRPLAGFAAERKRDAATRRFRPHGRKDASRHRRRPRDRF